MDLRDFGSTLARWWYLTLATLLLALGAGAAAYSATGPTYTATSTVLLLPPKAVLVAAAADSKNYAPNNPLLYLSTLTDARDVLVRNLSSTDVTDQLKKTAPGATTAVTADATSGSPLLLVKSTGSTAESALAGMKAVDALVPGTLKDFQDRMGIGNLQRIGSIQVTADSKAAAVNKSQIMMAVVSFAGVTVLGLALIALLDQLRNRRPSKGVAASRARGAQATGADTRSVETRGAGAKDIEPATTGAATTQAGSRTAQPTSGARQAPRTGRTKGKQA